LVAFGSTWDSGSGSTKRKVVALPSTASTVAVELSLPIVIFRSVMLMIRGSRAIWSKNIAMSWKPPLNSMSIGTSA
jgi:hypothetical protein